MSAARLERRLRIAAILVLAGLAVEMASLTWRHPLSFIAFVGVGGLAMASGILLFFHSIASSPTATKE